jgi:hypothetical protein
MRGERRWIGVGFASAVMVDDVLSGSGALPRGQGIRSL